jgi:regulator of sigma E protease
MSLDMLGQFILSLSLLIVLHECGHFFPARWFKTRVEKFYLFFDPWFSLFKKKIGDTEYGIGWLPLGGYVKISGMVDESMDIEQMKEPPKPWEFRSKPAWQRLIIMLGGVTVNFILGFLIFGLMAWHYGEDTLPPSSVKEGIYADSLGMQIGLQSGDRIISVGGKPFEKFDDRVVLRAIVFDGAKTLEIERAGQRQIINIPDGTVGMLTKFENKDKSLFAPRIPFKVGELSKDAPAQKAGLQVGDQILSLNGEPMVYLHTYTAFRNMLKDKKNTPIELIVLRGGKDTVELNFSTSAEGTIGLRPETDYKKLGFQVEHKTYTLLQALPMGAARGYDFLVNQIKAFGKMFKGEIKAKESVGGFKSIAQMFGTTWDWERFWLMTASLSLILGFMNLLPIPALDGGYVVFLIWEVVTGRRVSDAFMEKAVTVGFFLLLSLIVVINFWDFIR